MEASFSATEVDGDFRRSLPLFGAGGQTTGAPIPLNRRML